MFVHVCFLHEYLSSWLASHAPVFESFAETFHVKATVLRDRKVATGKKPWRGTVPRSSDLDCPTRINRVIRILVGPRGNNKTNKKHRNIVVYTQIRRQFRGTRSWIMSGNICGTNTGPTQGTSRRLLPCHTSFCGSCTYTFAFCFGCWSLLTFIC